MSVTKTKRPATTPRRPEKKFGPFNGGSAICVWLNHASTDDGPRFFRSVTISPRRFIDKKTGEWKDAGSLRSADLAAIILGLEAARAYIASTPLPGEPMEEEEEADDPPPQVNGDIPF